MGLGPILQTHGQSMSVIWNHPTRQRPSLDWNPGLQTPHLMLSSVIQAQETVLSASRDQSILQFPC